ncbi:methyltransferase domain-containing protein [Puia sp.]|jgi:SAM-dependent methyltransferase|uniref:methyltransferase domain-containing protein n=1 Tax=Puia sp. TaxID=2045100 RepID=UPI002F41D074
MPGKPDLSKRSYEKELLDGEGLPFPAIERNMLELDFINTWLGGHAISIQGLASFAHGRRRLHICEIGCGGGDNLRVLDRWCKKRGIDVRVTGIDSNPHCIEMARQRWKGDNADWIHSDYRAVSFGGEKPDILFSSLFCHHFTDEELVPQLRWMDDQARVGWFINDLHRHPLAFHSIRILTRWFSASYLVKNDAPLSVLRGFNRQEWKRLLQQAGSGASIKWKWAFRWLVISATRANQYA